MSEENPEHYVWDEDRQEPRPATSEESGAVAGPEVTESDAATEKGA